MKVTFRQAVASLLLLSSALADVVISQNTIVSSGDTLINDNFFVNSGVFYSIDRGMTHNWYKDITINGKLYVTNRDIKTGMTIDVCGTTGQITNNGWIVLDDGNATSAPTFDWYGGSFTNYGSVWFAGIGNTGGSTFAIQPAGPFNNNGTISLYQYNSRSGGTSHLGLDDHVITNTGTVCIYQNIFFQGSSVIGDGGCWDVGLNSNFWATNVNTRTMSEGQLIYLSTSSSSLRIDSYPPNIPIHVAGWGNNNVIGLSTVINSFTYDGNSLYITSGGYTYNLVIGPGYNPSLMSVGSANYGSGVGTIGKAGIMYSGPPPQVGRPSQCHACPPPPHAPSDTSVPNPTNVATSSWTGTFTTSTTILAPAGGTDTVVVEVPTTSNAQQTKTKTWTGTKTKTVTKTATPGGTDTVIIEIPSPTTNAPTTTTPTTAPTTTIAASSCSPATVTVTNSVSVPVTVTATVSVPVTVTVTTGFITYTTNVKCSVASVTVTSVSTMTSQATVPTTVVVTTTKAAPLRFFL
ncbi:Hyphally regulated cell wall protein N-terminal-domain-containing protein [Scheffersomyces xylosifermentans]|uniref:Hyphally regulated cell wall protein N-terminal-domain-containing protein n=1 Tax=Scheffersomyces xylosifermentans TaxID=1304137 RepID=UPI00315DC045